MSIAGVNGATPRRPDELTDVPREAPRREASTRAGYDAVPIRALESRPLPGPTGLPVAGEALDATIRKAKDVAERLWLSRGPSCQSAVRGMTDVLRADATRVLPHLEKLARDVEAAAPVLAKAGVDVGKVLGDLKSIVGGIKEMAAGAATVETIVGALVLVAGALSFLKGMAGLSGHTADATKSVIQAGRELSKINADLDAARPEVDRMLAHLLQVPDRLKTYCPVR